MMAEYFRDIRRRELGESPNTIRMTRFLIDFGLFEDNVPVDEWPRSRDYLNGWQSEVHFVQNEPKEPRAASPEAIKSLGTVVILVEGKECSICLMDFKKAEVAKSMPCKHMFHEICILTWLNQNNTCPFCRHRLPSITR